MKNYMLCPCGGVNSATARRLDYDKCCKLLHLGKSAGSPVALMRSRYTAYALNMEDYLLRTWHLDFRPVQISLQREVRWCHLKIHNTTVRGSEGDVNFVAIYLVQGRWHRLEEHSRFTKQNGEWWYTTGEAQTSVFEPQRNELCPCGSGNKYKRCCL